MSDYIKSKELRDKIRSCQYCGSGDALEMHHKDRDRNNNIDHNLIILCRPCHRKFHRTDTTLKKPTTGNKEKFSITMDADLFEMLNKVRKTQFKSRSQFITESVMKNIKLGDANVAF